MKILRLIGIVVTIISTIWVLVEPGFEPVIVLLSAIFTYGITFMNGKEDSDKKQEGKGGNAIVGGVGSGIDMDNQGTVEGGLGGTGGSGGDAIHVADGVKIRILNKGVIKGGDAGNK